VLSSEEKAVSVSLYVVYHNIITRFDDEEIMKALNIVVNAKEKIVDGST
jgi:hypothetical protein